MLSIQRMVQWMFLLQTLPPNNVCGYTYTITNKKEKNDYYRKTNRKRNY
jgi:hypothetical protein